RRRLVAGGQHERGHEQSSHGRVIPRAGRSIDLRGMSMKARRSCHPRPCTLPPEGGNRHAEIDEADLRSTSRSAVGSTSYVALNVNVRGQRRRQTVNVHLVWVQNRRFPRWSTSLDGAGSTLDGAGNSLPPRVAPRAILVWCVAMSSRPPEQPE